MTVEDLYRVLELSKELILGFAGGIVSTLVEYKKETDNNKDKNVKVSIKPSTILINIILGMFMAYNVGSVIPLDTIGRMAIIGLSAASAYQILLLANSRFAEWIIDKFMGPSNSNNNNSNRRRK